MLQRLGFSEDVATYLTGTCGIDSLDEIAYMDGVDDLDTTIKGVTSPGGTVTTGSGAAEATSRNNGIPISIRAVANLELCVYYLKHTERVQWKPVVNNINLNLVRSYQDQQRHESSFKKTAEKLVTNDKDWPSVEIFMSFCNLYDGCNSCKNSYLIRLSCRSVVKEGFAFGVFSLHFACRASRENNLPS
jgi:hypothetical protein